MRPLDDLDRRIIALLRADGRRPVAALAAELHVSRATAQTRLTRLVNEGAIRRFTVEVGPPGDDDGVRAVMLLQIKGATASTVARRLREIPAVRSMHSTNGEWDMVVQLCAESLADLDIVLNRTRRIEGISHTETSILLTSL